jgi:hypothetical protein
MISATSLTPPSTGLSGTEFSTLNSAGINDPEELNFLSDEGQTIDPDGKGTSGPDAVLSMVNWTLISCLVDTLSIFISNYLQ